MKTVEAHQEPQNRIYFGSAPLAGKRLLDGRYYPTGQAPLYEIDDIMTNSAQGVQFINVLLQNQAIEPIGESKSDYEIVLEIAKKLGKYEEITEGKT